MLFIISKVNCGAINSDDNSCQGYYIIRFSSSMYTLQEDLNIYVQLI